MSPRGTRACMNFVAESSTYLFLKRGVSQNRVGRGWADRGGSGVWYAAVLRPDRLAVKFTIILQDNPVFFTEERGGGD